MSAYWDALGRAALGLPGSAVPRPRSLFEPEEAPGDSQGLEAVEVEVDSPRKLAAPVDTAVPAAGEPRHSATIDDEEPVEFGPAAHGEPPEERPRSPQVQAPDATERAGDSVGPAATLTSRVERIDSHRVEIVKRQEEAPAAMPSVPLAQLVIAAPRDVQARQEAVASPPRDAQDAPAPREAEPIAVVARPRIEVPAPPPAPIDRPPPPLVIEIDRIEIRVEQERPAPVAPPRPRAAGAVPSLEDYLARRSQATP